MMRLKIALGLAVLAGLMAVMAGPASAAGPRWVTCKENSGHGQWENSLCTKEKANGNFETKELTETINVVSSSKGLELTDTKATGGQSTIICEGTDTGWAGANGEDGISKITTTGCTVKEGLCEKGSAATAVALNLPWFTRLVETGGEVRDIVEAKGEGPGYKVECTVDKIFKAADKCVGTTSTKTTNNLPAGSVEAEFESKSEKGNCELGGTGTGVVKGIDVSSLESGRGWWFLRF